MSDAAVYAGVAEDMAATLRPDGYQLDFTVRSLGELDRYLDAQGPVWAAAWRQGRRDWVSQLVTCQAFYVGETVRRSFDGRWREPGEGGGDPLGGVSLPGGRTVEPTAWVQHRLDGLLAAGGLHRLGWLLLTHSYLTPPDGAGWLPPDEAVARLLAAVPGARADDPAAVNAGNPLLAHFLQSDRLPAEVRAAVQKAAGGLRYVTVDDPAGGRLELDIPLDDRIPVHHPPRATPAVEACAAALGYRRVEVPVPPFDLPTAPRPRRSVWRRLFGGG